MKVPVEFTTAVRVHNGNLTRWQINRICKTVWPILHDRPITDTAHAAKWLFDRLAVLPSDVRTILVWVHRPKSPSERSGMDWKCLRRLCRKWTAERFDAINRLIFDENLMLIPFPSADYLGIGLKPY